MPGTGGPRRDPARRSTAILLRTGEEEVLIDCGRGAIYGLGDTVDCPGLCKLANGADVLAMCCYAGSSELTTESLRELARHTLACDDTVGKVAAACGVKPPVLTHHVLARPAPCWGSWRWKSRRTTAARS